MKKKTLWTTIGLWISTIVFMIIGLSLLSVSADIYTGKTPTNEVVWSKWNGFDVTKSEVARVIYNKTGVGWILSKDWDNDLYGLEKLKDIYMPNPTNEDNLKWDKMMKMYKLVRPGVIFSVIFTPIIAGISASITGYYLFKKYKKRS
ncbi:hypothetical protein [Spiroplasma sp. SV19]|uniref:hypothetical protein n=1 Tax=Spiroplasma sp. SV19 TaxID=2570468 RepID=UPI0024B6535C|nr:hypothetical protein [Spiroplasma sp. SV19]WHQ37192.1 hypothetical protein E7Y35_04795 [Spiroplasma sp. SV19]